MQYMRYARTSGDGDNTKDAISKAAILRAWSFLAKYKRMLIVFVLLIGLGRLIDLAPPLITKSIIDTAIPKRSLSLLYLLVGAALAATVTSTTISVASRWISSKMGESLILDLRSALFAHLQRLPIAFYTKSQSGSIVSRLNNDVLGSQQAISIISSVFSDVLTLTFTLFIMLKLSPSATAIALVTMPLLVVVDRKLGRRIAPLARNQMKANAQLSNLTTERMNVSGALLVKLFGNVTRETHNYDYRAGKLRDSGIKLAVAGRLYGAAVSLIAALGVTGIYLIGGRLALDRQLTIGTLVALTQFATNLYTPITDLATLKVTLSQSLVSFDRVAEVLAVAPTVTDPEFPKAIKEIEGKIAFENVDFTYPDIETPFSEAPDVQPSTTVALESISFIVEPGTMTAIVGPSGAGKSTIASLISRLYDPDAGEISLDGINLREISLQDLSDHIGVVSQETFLFHDTVASNLRFARPDATNEELIAATKGAQIYQTIMEMPDGFDTLVGERGYRLSGGERQRLAIARVFLKKPEIVILDEATSHLDTENEAAVQSALFNLLSNRTSIVIAHRLSTIVAADQIVVIKSGKIAEKGRHAELLEKKGVYRDLFETQLVLKQ